MAPSPDRRRRAGSPVTPVRTSSQVDVVAVLPPITRPPIRGRRPHALHEGETTGQIEGHRFECRPGQITGSVFEAEAHESPPGLVAPPRSPGSTHPRQRRHTAAADRARRRLLHQLVHRKCRQPCQPVEERARRRQPPFEDPAPQSPPGGDEPVGDGVRDEAPQEPTRWRWFPTPPWATGRSPRYRGPHRRGLPPRRRPAPPV